MYAMYILKFPIEVWLLLCDSVVAKVVCLYLLNAEEKITFVPESRQTLLAMANQLDKHVAQLIKFRLVLVRIVI